MGFSCSIGSNTFDILICLGAPWLFKSILNGKHAEYLIEVNSEGLAYTVISLLLSLAILYLILAVSKFTIVKTTAFICLGSISFVSF